ncbi:ATP-dependent DNA helicase RecG [Planctomycetota bacterium]
MKIQDYSSKLEDPVRFIRGVGPRRAELLEKLQIQSVYDLLHFYPRQYLERGEYVLIKNVKVEKKASIRGIVTSVSNRKTRYRKLLTEAVITDNSGSITAIWFNNRYIIKKLAIGNALNLHGRISFFRQLQIQNPEIEILGNVNEGYQFEPPPDTEPAPSAAPLAKYSTVEGLNQVFFRNAIGNALKTYAPACNDPLPPPLRQQNKLPDLATALIQVHQPQSMAEARAARRRFKYEELFRLEIGMALKAHAVGKSIKDHVVLIDDRLRERILKRFPFKLTPSQDHVIADVATDLASPRPMNRLLQGDVGSGKTVVALYAILATIANHGQAALMAPTGILAEQHYVTFKHWLKGSRTRFKLLTSSCGQKERKDILRELRDGTLHFVIGTHALIQEDVTFNRLQLAVIDEQHKFGVSQRTALRRKAPAVDLLVMTATPIPRTLTMTLFGDLEVSTLDELPPGRQPVRSRWVRPEDETGMDDFIKEKLTKGRQAYFVYPIIDPSEKLKLKPATEMARILAGSRFQDFRVGLLHGAMPHREKQNAMADFLAGKFHILVATPVIEVGIDIPNATVIVIEEAQRFGLSQLHQLRGRVGRGSHTSYAFFVGTPGTPESLARMKTIETSIDGFEIAEVDLKLRGPGEFFGTRQTGMPELKIANLIEDYPLLKLAVQDARKLVAADPEFQAPEHALLKEDLRRYFATRWQFAFSG